MTIRAIREKSDAVKFMESICGGPLTLAMALRSFRKCEEISQVDFAKKLGISKARLCDIEKGRKLVSPSLAAKYARILGESENLYVSLAVQDSFRREGLHYSVRLEAIKKSRSRSSGRQLGDHGRG